jgi:Ca2+-transporting ATPase
VDSPVTGAETDLIFLGLVGIDDPPREESREAIQACFAAGVRPLLVTGDHAATAMAIAQRLGLAGVDEVPVTGVDLKKMGEAELEAAVRTHMVFARTSAAQKLQIVSALQAAGEVVAVTGDGVNDAPALHKADIGVAMGIAGTDVAKESSDMIVTDDNFASIVAAIEEGRRIYDNIRNVVVYLIGGNIGEIMVLFFGVVAGLPLPLLATQILFVNLVTDGPPAIGLAVEATDPIALQRPPRPRNESMLTVPIWSTVLARGAILAAAVLFAFTLSYEMLGYDLATARTIGFTTLVVAHVLKSFTCRSLYLPVWKLPATANPQLLGAVLLSLGALLFVVVAPPLQDAFDTTTLDAGQWTMAIGIALVPLVLIEALKVSPWRLRR